MIAQVMDVSSSFSALGVLQTPPSTRLLVSACCPDKDLIVLISRLGGRDRLGLWNYTHGSKIWEVDVGVGDESTVIDIVDIAWSPDGMFLVLTFDVPYLRVRPVDSRCSQSPPRHPPFPTRWHKTIYPTLASTFSISALQDDRRVVVLRRSARE